MSSEAVGADLPAPVAQRASALQPELDYLQLFICSALIDQPQPLTVEFMPIL